MKHTYLIHTTHVVSSNQPLTLKEQEDIRQNVQNAALSNYHEGGVTGDLTTEAAIDVQDPVTILGPV